MDSPYPVTSLYGLSTELLVKWFDVFSFRFVTILDPCISTGEPNCTYRPYDLGMQFGVWVHKPSGEPVLGKQDIVCNCEVQ
jgi:hypothetical protein